MIFRTRAIVTLDAEEIWHQIAVNTRLKAINPKLKKKTKLKS